MAIIEAPQSLDTNLSQLLHEVDNCRMQLPDFQRKWTWDDERIRKILASLSQGYPMGAIMRLEYGNEQVRFKYRPIEGVKENGASPDHLILDGQQRMTSLYRSLMSKNPVETVNAQKDTIYRYYYLDMKKCLDPSCDREDAVISIPKDKMKKSNFDRDVDMDLSTAEQEYKLEMFPLNIIFDSNAREDWGDGYKEYYNYSEEHKKRYKEFRKNVLEIMTGYKLPVITLMKSTPRDAVCKVFENVNTGGVPLTVFELVTATYATYEFDLREDWKKCQRIISGADESLQTDVMDGVDETTYLTAVTLYNSYNNKKAGKSMGVSCKKKDVLDLPYPDYISSKEAVINGFRYARKLLLQYECVFRKRDLPYTTQLIPLAAICAVLGESKCFEANTIKILSRWFWCGILGEMYGGANETRYANDIEDVIDEIEGKPSKNRTVNAAFFSATRLLTLQTRNSAAYKGIMALLYKKKCRDFMNDLTIDIINSMVESPDIHHIFPEAYCENCNIDRKKYNSIVNKTPILPKTNRTIGGRAPSIYSKTILKSVDGLTESELQSRIESHLIDYTSFVTDDFDTYFIARAKALIVLIEDAMGKNIADKGADQTVRLYGISLE